MEPIREHLEQQQAPTAGIAKDLQRMKTDGAATAAELREFIGQLQGRSPQEVMGVVAQSDLVRSIAVAAVGCIVLLVVLTVIPYALRDSGPDSPLAPATVAVEAADGGEPVVDDAPASAETAAAAADQPDLERAAAAMGIGDAAPADSDAQPLDDKLDKLLDGLD